MLTAMTKIQKKADTSKNCETAPWTTQSPEGSQSTCWPELAARPTMYAIEAKRSHTERIMIRR